MAESINSFVTSSYLGGKISRDLTLWCRVGNGEVECWLDDKVEGNSAKVHGQSRGIREGQASGNSLKIIYDTL
jgi:hypothetical protein